MAYDSSSIPLVIRLNSRGQPNGLRQALDIGASSLKTEYLIPANEELTITVSGAGAKFIVPVVSATTFQGGGLTAEDAYFSALVDGPGGYGSNGQFVVTNGSEIIFSGSLPNLIAHLADTSNPHEVALSALTDVSSGINPSNNQSLVWDGTRWTASSIEGGVGGGVTDHGALTGLSDNDHPQYVLSSTNQGLSASVESHVNDPAIHFIEAAIDHGSIAGLSDNDHPQYVLSATNQALSSLVTNVQTSTINVSAYIAENEPTWATDTNTDSLSGLTDTTIETTPTTGQVLMWVNNNWEPSTSPVGVTDHGLLAGLSDNDHPQYVLSATNSALSSLVTNIQTSTVSLSAYIAANEGTWTTDTNTDSLSGLTDTLIEVEPVIGEILMWTGDHWEASSIEATPGGAIDALGDLNDYPTSYATASGDAGKFLIVGPDGSAVTFSGNFGDIATISSLAESVETSTVDLSAYIAANEATWSTDTNTTDHGALTGLSDNDHPQYVLSATNSALSSLVTSVETSTVDLSAYITANEAIWSTDTNTTDHGALTGLGDDDHPQYVLSATNSALSSLVTSVETSTVDLSAYIAANETAWNTDNDTTDHGALTGLGDDDHTQYIRVDGTRAFTGRVSGVDPVNTPDLATAGWVLGSFALAANLLSHTGDTTNPHNTSVNNLSGMAIGSKPVEGDMLIANADGDFENIPYTDLGLVTQTTNTNLSAAVDTLETSANTLANYGIKYNAYHEWFGAITQVQNWSRILTGDAFNYITQPMWATAMQHKNTLAWITLQIATGSTGTNGVFLSTANRGRFFMPGKAMEFVFNIQGVNAVQQANLGHFGNNATPAAVTDLPAAGAYFFIDSTGGLSACACNTTTSSFYDTGVTLASNTLCVVSLAMNSSGGVDFYVPSVSGTAIVATAPASTCPSTTTEKNGSVFLSIVKDNAAGTAQCQLQVSRISNFVPEIIDDLWGGVGNA